MKTSAVALAVLGFFPVAMAQTTSQSLAPSPTESVGCHPHGDHWHCEGPRETEAVVTTTAEEHDHDPDHEETGSASLPPSPTESVGCHPHGDHWHCDGPVETGAAATTTAAEEDHDHDHDHEETGTASLAPSPTESVGCHPHGDHWHCDGPRTGTGMTTVASTTSADGNATATGAVPTAGAALHAVPVVGALAGLVLAF